MSLFRSIVLVLALVGCGNATTSAPAATTSGTETSQATSTESNESSIGHVTFEAVTADGPQVSIGDLEAYLASPEAVAATRSCVDRFGDMFQSGAGVMEFQVADDGTAGRLEAPPLDTFGGALAGCVFSEVIEPHHFTPWAPPSGVQVSVRVRFARVAH
jgi:hypothetical protein